MERYYALSSSLLVAGGRAGARWAGYGFGAIFRLSFDQPSMRSLHHHRIAVAWSHAQGMAWPSGPAVTIDTT